MTDTLYGGSKRNDACPNCQGSFKVQINLLSIGIKTARTVMPDLSVTILTRY
jgi:hypothetical protein